MPSLTAHLRRALALCAVFASAGCIAPQSVAYPDRQDAASPPWIAGSVSYTSGDVQIAQPGETPESRDWRPAVVNDVVTNSTNLFAAPGAAAEVRVGGHALRLAENTRVVVRSLDADQSTLQLDSGTLNVRWRDVDQRMRVDVLTPNGRIALRGAGRYRIDTDGHRTTVTVFQGHAQLSDANGTVSVDGNRALTLAGQNFSFGPAVSTSFDEWALERDERYARAPRYVSPNMTGADQLDAYGRWEPDPTYGTVWIPAEVPVGWAPYRYGHWQWVPPWGWTWVDDAPWGFAPFHYGRWVYLDERWAWCPGAYVARPIYAPALVGFAGGSSVSVAISIGSPPAAWYPLAPWQVYRPWYPHSTTYITNINNTVVINNPPPAVPPQLHQQIGTTTADDLRHRPTLPTRDQAQGVRTVPPGVPATAGRPTTSVATPRSFVGRPAANLEPAPSATPAPPGAVGPARTPPTVVAPRAAVPISPPSPPSPVAPATRMGPGMRAEPFERENAPRQPRSPESGFVAPHRPPPVSPAVPQVLATPPTVRPNAAPGFSPPPAAPTMRAQPVPMPPAAVAAPHASPEARGAREAREPGDRGHPQQGAPGRERFNRVD